MTRILLGVLAGVVVVGVVVITSSPTLFQGKIFARINPVTRCELMSKIIAAQKIKPFTPQVATFIDVPTDHPCFSAIETGKRKGWIQGYKDGNFQPNKSLIRAEVAKVVVTAWKVTEVIPNVPSFVDVPTNAWYYNSVESLFKKIGTKICSTDNPLKSKSSCKDGKFNPTDTATETWAQYVVNAMAAL